MSMSRGCVVVERNPGQWFCAIASDEYDYEFKHYTVYGPKSTSDAALDEMHRHECNPGSYDVVNHTSLDDYHRKLIDNGPKPYTEQIPNPWGGRPICSRFLF